MCLTKRRKVEKPYDTIGFKVVQVTKGEAHDRLRGVLSWHQYDGVGFWEQARAAYSPFEFGFHAYMTYRDADDARRLHVKRGFNNVRIILVELSDVIEEGMDGSFSYDSTVPCVAARAMRILRWMEEGGTPCA